MTRKIVTGVMFAAALGQFFCAACAAQEVDFRGWEDRPGLYFYLVQPASLWQTGVLSVVRSPVRDHVRGGHALRLTFRASARRAGVVVYRPPGFAVGSRVPYQALCFWVKGDGSDGVGVIGIGEGADADPRARFPLRSTTWQPVRLRWSNFDRPIKTADIRALFFGVTPETKRPASYLIDRIELARSGGASIKDDAVRKAGADAAKLADVPQPKDFSTFVTHADALAKFRARVKAKKPVRVLVVGNTVAQGSGLWNVPQGMRSGHLFWGVLDSELRKRGAESTVGLLAAADASDAASRIQVALFRFKPDLVIVQFSTSAPGAARPGIRTRTRDALRTMFGICRRGKVDVVALGVPALPDRYRRTNVAEILLAEAARAGIPSADFGRLAAARGKGFQGEYHATPGQLNVQGHLLAAKLLTSFLAEP